jgi:hypothetical protein
MSILGGAGIVFWLRGFNEYLFNTAIIAVLLPLLARVFVLSAEFARTKDRTVMRYTVLLGAAFTVFYWGYQDVLMRISPGKYFERSSRWATANYLQSWSTGFGVKEIVAMLEKEKRPGIVFTDTQWGNPRTALELYRSKRFPNLRLVPISKEFLDPSATRKLADDAKKMAPTRFAIFSADRSDERWQWIENAEREMCETRTEIREHSSQTPIVVCQF